MEPVDLWKKGVPEKYREAAPVFPPHKLGEGFQKQAGGWDPNARIEEMEIDGLSAEVLYPTLALSLFAIPDAGLQQACFRVYNDWLIEYCSVDHRRLIGIPAISIYDVDYAVAELERCHKAGLKGALIWQAPHPDLPFHSKHYEKFWAAVQELKAPVSLHILTGHGYQAQNLQGIERYRGSVNLKLLEIANALFDFIFYGVLDRHPGLKLVSVENESGWMPFMLQQWDYYYRRFRDVNPLPITHDPSDYMREQRLRLVFQRRRRRPQPRVVGRGQPHVVERLPASQLDLAELAQGDRARPGASLAGSADEGAGDQRLQPVRHRRGGSSEWFGETGSGGLVFSARAMTLAAQM